VTRRENGQRGVCAEENILEMDVKVRFSLKEKVLQQVKGYNYGNEEKKRN